MNNIFNEWLFMPLIIPSIFLIIALVFRNNLPKNINYLYGYKTPSSMKNKDTWDEANLYSSKLLLKTYIIFLIVVFIFASIFQNFLKNTFGEILSFVGTCSFVAVLPSILVIALTEVHLGKVFDKHGNRK